MINFRGLFNKSVLTSNTARAKRILRSNAPGAWYDPSDLTQAKATWRRNLLTETEFRNGVADAPVRSGPITATTLAGYGGAILIGQDGVNGPYAYKNATLVSDATYTLSFIVEMTDGNAPVFTDANPTLSANTFAISFESTVIDPRPCVVTPLGGALYRVSVTRVATGLAGSNFGAAKYLTQTRTFKITAYQLEVGTSASTYQPITNFTSDFLAAFPQHALYQDSAGTTPVTAVEQPVGLILDKSKGLVLGAELVPSLDFATWPSTAVTAKSGGSFTTAASGGCWFTVPGWTSTKSYKLRLVGTCPNTWNLRNADNGLNITSVSAGAFDLNIPLTSVLQSSTAGNLYFQVIGAGTFTVTSISLKELPGNHLIQPTVTSRPTLSSRYNLLTKTEAFDDAYWTGVGGSVPVRVANDAVAPDGTTTADKLTFSTATTADMSLLIGGVSGLVTGGSYVVKAFVKAATPGDVGKSIVYRTVAGNSYSVLTLTTDYQQISLTGVAAGPSTDGLSIGLRPSEGGSTGTVSVHIWGASLTTAADASLPYQRVNTATDYDYDFSKFPAYLKFDGVDDSLYSAASVDFTSTDKMTVFAGVHKASDAALGMMLEYGNAGTDPFQVVQVQIPGSNPTTQKVITTTLGTAAAYVIADSADYSAPKTLVYSAVMDIAGDSLVVRLNSAQVGSSSADQGTGNYGNKPLYIGRRNNASFPFSGRIYQLAIKGKSMSAAEISTVESFINLKTKAYDPYLSALLTELGDEFITESGDYITLE